VDNFEHAKIMHAYGLFLVMWSIFESLLDYLIERETKLDPLRAIIIISGLGFERKAGITRSLLSLDSKNTDAIAAISKFITDAGRNGMIHGEVHLGLKHIEFVKHKTDHSLKTSIKSFTAGELSALVGKMSTAMQVIQDLVGVQDDDLLRHSEIAKNFWNKSATSPKPPSSSTS